MWSRAYRDASLVPQAHMQEVGMGGSNLLNSRSQMQGYGAQPPAAVAYLTKNNP